ncbi:nucleoside hydrolase [Streptomyces aculeolatus]
MPSSRRIIISTDAKNEADDQFAIVHALLSDTLDIRGIVPAHFGEREGRDTMRESRAEVDLLLGLTGRTDVPVADGAARRLSAPDTPIAAPGTEMIIKEAMADDGPLYIAVLGPLTDVASALLLAPEIQDRDVTVVWIGGGPYDGLWACYWPCFNLGNDIAAANVVFGSRLKLWQVPMSTYVRVNVGYGELRQKVAPHGLVGAYLVQQLMDWNAANNPQPADYRSLGDSPAVALVLNPTAGLMRERDRPLFGQDGSYIPGAGGVVRVCESVDTRYVLEDFFAKVHAHAGTMP